MSVKLDISPDLYLFIFNIFYINTFIYEPPFIFSTLCPNASLTLSSPVCIHSIDTVGHVLDCSRFIPIDSYKT